MQQQNEQKIEQLPEVDGEQKNNIKNAIIEGETQQAKICEYYVARKKRTCKFKAMKGSKYCSGHCSDQNNKIQCPFEKGLFIDESRFQKHLQICPMIKNKKKTQEQVWFNKGVNLNQSTQQNKVANINSVIDIQAQILMKLMKKVVHFYQKCFQQKTVQYVWSTEAEKIEGLTNDHTQGHLLAEAAYKAELIRDDIIYLEFGAGKGILSYYLAEKVKKQFNKLSKNILLQRQARRNKFDRFMKNNPYFQRFKSDVSDFDASKIPQIMAQFAFSRNPTLDVKKQAAELNQLKIVGVCKHMCGGALDISLRALLKTKMSGCILASCCHHLCTYDTYLNNQFFQNNNFSKEQIQMLFRISAWGTKSTVIRVEQIDLQLLKTIQYGLFVGNYKVIVGRMCKRLIDLGRSQFLSCELLRYCSDQITPQNFVIISK